MADTALAVRESLFHIEDDLAALLNSADMVEGPEQETMYLAELEAVLLRAVAKRDAVTEFRQRLLDVQAACDARTAQLAEHKATAARKLVALDKYIVNVMKNAGVAKLEGSTSTLSLHKCPASVKITDEFAIPAAYLTVKQETVILKTPIKEALKRGEEVPGAELVTDKVSLVIK